MLGDGSIDKWHRDRRDSSPRWDKEEELMKCGPDSSDTAPAPICIAASATSELQTGAVTYDG
jgi:hypothetical protein